LQIPQVTVLPNPAEPKAVEGDEPSANGIGGEKGAFAILLAVLQGNGSVQAAPVQVDAVAVESKTTGSNASTGAAKGGSASSISQHPLLADSGRVKGGEAGPNVAAPAAAATPTAEPEAQGVNAGKQATESAPDKSNGTSPAVQTPDAGKTVLAAKPFVVIEVALPVPSDAPKLNSSAQYVVPETNLADPKSSESTGPLTRAAPATTPVAESETGIPIARLIDASDAEVTAESKPAAPADDGDGPKARLAGPQSTARFVVAKPDAVVAESPKAKAEGAPKPLSPALTGTSGQETPESEVDPVSKVLGGEKSAVHEEQAQNPVRVRAAASPVQHSDGVRPVTSEAPPAVSVQVEQTAPATGSERVKPDVDQAASPDRTTVKTIAIDTVKGVRYLLTKGEQTMRIRLVPETLGELRLVVTSSGDEITVRLASANHGVRELLHTQIQQLREVLAQDGTPVGKITITGDMSAGTGNGNLLSGSPDRGLTPHARGWTGNTSGSPNQTPTNGQQPVAVPRSSVTHAGTLNLFA
jgi:flagellar hook-length control protein FliK